MTVFVDKLLMCYHSTGTQQLCRYKQIVAFVSKSSVTIDFFVFRHFQTVIKAMPELNPPVSLELSENETRVKYMLEETNKPDYEFPEVRWILLQA